MGGLFLYYTTGVVLLSLTMLPTMALRLFWSVKKTTGHTSQCYQP